MGAGVLRRPEHLDPRGRGGLGAARAKPPGMRRSQKAAERAERLFETPILIAALLVLPALTLQDSTLGAPWNAIGFWLDVLIWVAFAAELVVMLLVTPAPLRWLRHNPLSPVIVVLTPPFAPAALASLRLLRLLRLLTLLRRGAIARNVFSLEGLRLGGLITGVTVILGGIAFTQVETSRELSVIDGIWWAVTTVTTVGYGDIVPTSNASRVVALAVMSVGIGFVALVTGVAAERFLNMSEEEREEDQERVQILSEVHALRTELAELRQLLERRG